MNELQMTLNLMQICLPIRFAAVIVLALLAGGCDSKNASVPESKAKEIESAAESRQELDALRRSAEQGDPEAQIRFGSRYFHGNGVPKNQAEAFRWYMKAAEHENPKAQRNVGICYLRGEGVPKNEAEGVRWFKLAAEQGDSDAQYLLGLCYNEGNGIPKDYTEAIEWLKRAAEQGDPGAQRCLGIYYRDGIACSADVVLAYMWLSLAASGSYSSSIDWDDDRSEAASKRDELEKQMTSSQIALAQTLSRNWRSKHDTKEVEEPRAAAETGKTSPKPVRENHDDLRKRAESGDAEAQYRLGVSYLTPEGSNDSEAVVWFKKAAEQGHAKAQNNLGAAYLAGKGIPKNAKEAVKWYRKAADIGNAEAQYGLGSCYLMGEGVPKDSAEALKWIRTAADNGSAGAQYGMGTFYVRGQGVPVDFVRAYMWFSLAVSEPSIESDGTQILDALAKKMTPEQIAHAQGLSQEWMSKRSRR